MFDIQNMETGEVELEMISAEELRDFCSFHFPWEEFAGASFLDCKSMLETANFKVYQID